MKKLFSGLLTAVLTLSFAASAFAANDSTVSIKNDTKTVAYGYSSKSSTDATTSITKLITKLDELKNNGDSLTQVLTIKNESQNTTPTDITLRLLDTNIYGSNADTGESVLNDYSIVITNPSGEVVAEAKSEDIYVSEADIFALDLPLGTFNQQFEKETNVYNLEIALNTQKDADKVISAVDWNIVCTTSKPSDTTASTDTTVTDAPVATPSVTSATNTTDISNTDSKKLVKYVGAGKDVAPGKYTITGNGAVKVYNSANELKTSIMLTDGKDTTKKGVGAYSLALNEGDRIEMADYINLKAITGTTGTTGTTTKTKATTAAAGNKTNPKTGDVAPVAVISIVAIASLSICAYLELKKRKTE